MAKFDFTIPKEIIDDIRLINNNTDKIFGAMVKAGAEVVMQNVKANVPISELASHVKISRVYKTPSDDGINVKVYISGYFSFSEGRTSFSHRANGSVYTTTKGIPAPFVANILEYGTSNRYTEKGAFRGKITKKPFFRKSFKWVQIKAEMLKAQRQQSGGLLE